MARRKREPEPATPRVVHGPTPPAGNLSGMEQLRKVLNLSAEVDPDRVAREAAAEILELHRRPPVRDPLEDAPKWLR